MRLLNSALLVFAFVTAGLAQSTEPPISNSRLTVHTLVREDIFAGFLDDNMTRFERGERNVERLLADRPAQRGNLLAWKAGATLYRAVLAHEAGKAEEFERYLQQARDGFAEATGTSSGNEGVPAIIGGSYAVFADRLPEPHRAAAWAQAYEAYSTLWKQQSSAIDNFPVHFRGELLGGLAQAAQRTGRTEEAAQYVDRMLATLQGTRYERPAREWKENPDAARSTALTCKTCHNPGRLSARLAALDK